MVTSVNPSSLRVSWQPPPEIDHNGVINGYLIQYTRVDTSDMMSESVISGLLHTISGLDPFVDYLVIVTAMTINGTGPFSNPEVQTSGQNSKAYDNYI